MLKLGKIYFTFKSHKFKIHKNDLLKSWSSWRILNLCDSSAILVYRFLTISDPSNTYFNSAVTPWYTKYSVHFASLQMVIRWYQPGDLLLLSYRRQIDTTKAYRHLWLQYAHFFKSNPIFDRPSLRCSKIIATWLATFKAQMEYSKVAIFLYFAKIS